jgi:ribosomal protein S6--L-glutamate ligase
MPINLFIIHSHLPHRSSIDLLVQSAKNNGLEVVEIDADLFDEEEFFNKHTVPGIFYRMSLGNSAYTVEAIFLAHGFTSLYSEDFKKRILDKNVENIFLNTEGIPIPKTIFSPSRNRMVLDKQLITLGKPPFVIKVLGGYGGIGVMKVDSTESLYGVIDFLFANNFEFTVMEYIDFKLYGRLFVLGNEVIASKQNLKQEGDFRTNEGTPLPKEFSSAIKESSIKAVKALGFEYGGVDVLVKEDGSFFIIEVNFPSSFRSTQETSGIQISELIMKYLKNKHLSKYPKI